MDSPFILLDCSRLKARGWKAQFNIEESVRATTRYLLAHPDVLSRA